MITFSVPKDLLLYSHEMGTPSDFSVHGFSGGQGEDGSSMTFRTATVSSTGQQPWTGDPYWPDVELLMQAPESGSTIADAKGHGISVGGGTTVSTALGYPTIYFDGNGDDLLIGSAGDFNLLHDGSVWTLDFIFRPSRTNTDNTIVCTNGGSTSNHGLFLAFNAGKLQMFTSNGSTFVVGSATVSARTFDYSFSVDTECHVAIDYDLSRSSNHVRLYVDGVHVASISKTANAPSTANSLQMLVGLFSRSYPAYAYQGHIRALRITKGLRDVSTPPSWPYLME